MTEEETQDALNEAEWMYGYWPYFEIPMCLDCKSVTELKLHPDDKKYRCPDCFEVKTEHTRQYRLLDKGMW